MYRLGAAHHCKRPVTADDEALISTMYDEVLFTYTKRTNMWRQTPVTETSYSSIIITDRGSDCSLQVS